MRLLRGHESEILSLEYTRDSSALISAAEDKTVRIWDLATGSERHVLRADRSLGGSVSLSPDGKVLASGGEQRLTLWSTTDWKRVADLFEDQFAKPCAHGGDINAVAFSPHGRHLASVGDDGLTKVWDTHTGRKLATLTGHAGEVLSAAWARPGLLATGGSDGTLKVWLPETNSRRSNWKLGATVWELAIAPGGALLAAAAGSALRLFSLTRSEEQEGIVIDGASLRRVAFAPLSGYIATGCDDGSVRFFDVGSGREMAAFGWDVGILNVLAFAPDGMTVAAGGSSPDVVVWDL